MSLGGEREIGKPIPVYLITHMLFWCVYVLNRFSISEFKSGLERRPSPLWLHEPSVGLYFSLVLRFLIQEEGQVWNPLQGKYEELRNFDIDTDRTLLRDRWGEKNQKKAVKERLFW